MKRGASKSILLGTLAIFIVSISTYIIVTLTKANMQSGLKMARAAGNFNVNSTIDEDDDNPGDGICHTSSGFCTLRAAISESNALAGPNEVDIPAGTYTLSIAGRDEDSNATGDLDITSVITMVGAGATSTIIDANQIDRVIHVTSTGSLQVSGLTLKDGQLNTGQSNTFGGGLYNQGAVDIINLIVSNNTAESGAGIYNDPGKTVTTKNIAVINNLVTDTATGTGGGITNKGTLNITNGTISGNTVSSIGSANGGGIAVFGTSNLRSVTVANNTAASNNGGGIYADAAASVQLTNSILSDNNGGNCRVGAPSAITSNGNNISSDSSCATVLIGPNDLSSTNPLLSSLSDNGGGTMTHALQTRSPAIDTGASCGSSDQRGTSRPQDGDNNGTSTCDIGAFELVFVAPTATPTPGATATPTPSPTGPTATPVPGATNTPTPTSGATSTPGPTVTSTPGPSATPRAAPSGSTSTPKPTSSSNNSSSSTPTSSILTIKNKSSVLTTLTPSGSVIGSSNLLVTGTNNPFIYLVPLALVIIGILL